MAIGIGILFISHTPGYNIDLMSYLFGNILLVSRQDLLFMLLLDIVIITSVCIFYKQILATAFDKEFASLRGINVELAYIGMLCMIALTVVLLINIVGLILILALLILPAASAAQFATSISKMMVLSVLMSICITVSGLMLSFQPDLPSGSLL